MFRVDRHSLKSNTIVAMLPFLLFFSTKINLFRYKIRYIKGWRNFSKGKIYPVEEEYSEGKFEKDGI